jgi:hypothetical protein
MLHAIGPAAARVAVVVPVVVLMLFIGPLWLLGLVCGKGGREYVTKISDQAMRAACTMLQGANSQDPSAPGQLPAPTSSRSPVQRRQRPNTSGSRSVTGT